MSNSSNSAGSSGGVSINAYGTSLQSANMTQLASAFEMPKPAEIIAKQKDQYAITYSGNGNTKGYAPANQIAAYATPIKIRSNTGGLAKTGFIFDGWNTKANRTGKPYSTGEDTFMPTNGLRLYASWKPQGGTWTIEKPLMVNGIWKKVYLPKDIAQEYYNIISDENILKEIVVYIKTVGATVATLKVVEKFGKKIAVVALVVDSLVFVNNISGSLNERSFKTVLQKCSPNGFVVAEYWITGMGTRSLVPMMSIKYSNESKIEFDTGSFQAGIYRVE